MRKAAVWASSLAEQSREIARRCFSLQSAQVAENARPTCERSGRPGGAAIGGGPTNCETATVLMVSSQADEPTRSARRRGSVSRARNGRDQRREPNSPARGTQRTCMAAFPMRRLSPAVSITRADDLAPPCRVRTPLVRLLCGDERTHLVGRFFCLSAVENRVLCPPRLRASVYREEHSAIGGRHGGAVPQIMLETTPPRLDPIRAPRADRCRNATPIHKIYQCIDVGHAGRRDSTGFNSAEGHGTSHLFTG